MSTTKLDQLKKDVRSLISERLWFFLSDLKAINAHAIKSIIYHGKNDYFEIEFYAADPYFLQTKFEDTQALLHAYEESGLLNDGVEEIVFSPEELGL